MDEKTGNEASTVTSKNSGGNTVGHDVEEELCVSYTAAHRSSDVVGFLDVGVVG